MKPSNYVKELSSILQGMKRHHITHGTAVVELRYDRLIRCERLITEQHKKIIAAISADFGHRSNYQSWVADIIKTVRMLSHAATNVRNWMEPEIIRAPYPGMHTKIEHQPLGVVGVIGSWNLPVNLALGPLAGVFAAGNTALLKLSELTPRTSELLAELVAKYFDPMELGVVLGGADVGAAFSRLCFDHLLFIGSTNGGRAVMRAAAENLVPVTLELGGKSPVVVDLDANPITTMERILTAKTFNAGQTYLAPDYMIVPTTMSLALIDAAHNFTLETLPSIQGNSDYTTIINSEHYERLLNLLKDASERGATVVSLAPNGEPPYDSVTRTIAPHLILDTNDDMKIMQDEILGPFLPIKTYADMGEAIAYINSRSRPLAAYFFGNSETVQKEFCQRVSSGSFVINDAMVHATIEDLPFGCVGASGMGSYHGIHGFRQFTHRKAVVSQSAEGSHILGLRPPYIEKLRSLEYFDNI